MPLYTNHFICYAKTKKYIVSILLFVSFFLSLSKGIASPDNSCNTAEIKKELVYLGLNPTIENNKELLKDIESKYPEDFVRKVEEEIQHIKHDSDGSFDIKTLEYIERIGFSGLYSPGVSYFMSPFKTSLNDYGAELFIKTLLPYVYPVFKARMIILNQEQLEAFKKKYNDDNFRCDLEDYLKSAGVKSSKVEVVLTQLYNQLFDNENYILHNDEEKLKYINNHHVMIIGFNNPGEDNIFFNGAELEYKDIVTLLEETALPPYVIYNLKHDYAGVGKGDKEISKDIKHIQAAFLNKKISELWGDKTESYAYKFSKHLYEKSRFKGEVISYIGEMVFDYNQNGHIRDPKNTNALVRYKPINSVLVRTGNEIELYFDYSEMMIKYKKDDFPPRS